MPSGIPPQVSERLSAALRAALGKPEVQARISALSAEPAYLDSEAFSRFIADESRKWAGVIASMPKPQK